MCSYVVLTTRPVLHGNKMVVALLAPDVTGGPGRAKIASRWSSIFVPHKVACADSPHGEKKHLHGLWASDARTPELYVCHVHLLNPLMITKWS
jgi:hypothetical protein